MTIITFFSLACSVGNLTLNCFIGTTQRIVFNSARVDNMTVNLFLRTNQSITGQGQVVYLKSLKNILVG